MKANLWSMIAVAGACIAPMTANAQDVMVISEESVAVTEIPCDVHYYSKAGDNWFVQAGAGVQSPFVEYAMPAGHGKSHHLTPWYNFGFGKWMTPYVGFRLGFNYGMIRWDNEVTSKAKSLNANFDVMWDMFNSFGGVNSGRFFSVVPYVGLGGTYNLEFRGNTNIDGEHGPKRTSWTLPVSAGLQLRFRLCKYVDFFAEGRAQFYGDNYNNTAYGEPVDMNFSVIGGFTVNFGGSDFKSYDPCADAAYIASLNDQVNALRNEVATAQAAAAAAMAAAATTPTEVIVENNCPSAPLVATVRFTINSDEITPEEQVNVYNVAEWMKANPAANVAINGYADEDTGTSEYNMALSQRRAQAVYDMLTNTYGISSSRLVTNAYGSNTQPYTTNNWNRIVIFEVK